MQKVISGIPIRTEIGRQLCNLLLAKVVHDLERHAIFLCFFFVLRHIVTNTLL